MKNLLALVSCLLLLITVGCGLDQPIRSSSSPSAQNQISSITESSSSPSSAEQSSSATSSASSSAHSSVLQNSAPSASSSDIDLMSLPTWKRLYISYAQILSKDYNQYALIHIDNDGIPELYMSGTSKNTILTMSTLNEHATTSYTLDAYNTAYYIPKSGKIMNAFVDGDHLTMAIYRFDGYLQLVFQGFEYQVLLEDGSQSKLYYFDGKSTPVSEDAMKAAVAEHFDTTAAIKISDHFMSLDKLKTAILNW